MYVLEFSCSISKKSSLQLSLSNSSLYHFRLSLKICLTIIVMAFYVSASKPNKQNLNGNVKAFLIYTFVQNLPFSVNVSFSITRLFDVDIYVH